MASSRLMSAQLRRLCSHRRVSKGSKNSISRRTAPRLASIALRPRAPICVRAAGSASNSPTTAASAGASGDDAHGAAFDQQLRDVGGVEVVRTRERPAGRAQQARAGCARRWARGCRRRTPRRRPHRTAAIRRACRAGTPACPAVGAPLVRVTKRTPLSRRVAATSANRGGCRGTSTSSAFENRCAHLAVRGEQHVFFRSRACCPRPRPAGARPAVAAALRPRFDVGWIAEIELDVAHHVGVRRTRADGLETLGVLRALRRDENAVRQRLAEQADEPPITRHRARRDARAREHQRHAEPAAAVIQVRPDLRFEDHGEPRLHAPEEAPHRSRQVDGHVTHVDALLEQRLRARATRRRDGREYQRNRPETASAALRPAAPLPALRPPIRHAPRCCALGDRRTKAETLRESLPMACARGSRAARARRSRSARSDRR